MIPIAKLFLLLGILGASRPSAPPVDVQDVQMRDRQTPQCGHWAILRCCEMCGVPLDMVEIISLMPFDERGHSMWTMVRTLEAIGLKVGAKKTGFRQLLRGPFPVIAHLEPDHYVTVVHADDQCLILFDGYGRRRKRLTEEFKKQWSGKALYVSRPRADVPLPAFLPADTAESPRVQFDTLIIDKGEIEDTGQTVEYVFSFTNVGQSALKVEQIKTTCSCVSSQKPERPIAPMERGAITLQYSVKKSLGSFSQEAYVHTNDPTFPVVRLTASGNTNRTVSVSPKYLNLGRVVAGTPCSTLCAIEHAGDDPLLIQAIENGGEGVGVRYRLIDPYVSAQKSVGAKENTVRLEFLFTYDASVLGRRTTDIHINTNIRGYERLTLPVRVHVVPPIELHPGVLTFSAQDPPSKSIIAVSLDNRLFRIVRVDAAHLGLTCSFPPDPASEAEITWTGTTKLNGEARKDESVDIEFEFVDTREHLTTKLPVYFWN